ncbi:isochorismate synthase [Halogeometricum borinquense DSM 11551]|uniref:isochorismate synthase n=2 Tax=Halogeometricum borinquense (strain ATCC 700274 / DSM 11551 / JCM 10706 / KCTC 4070 / PR3) TaxID=469382 RepID=L9UUY6_HALBP|nr:isochorismate synthase [Halogeometricum borinquense]ELY28546.1 isochorismate synthase [Halogeometricum borinquense DSM 11551]
MASLRTGEMEMHLVSRSVPVSAPSFRAVLRAADAPRTVWSAPDKATVVGSGAAATVTADGPDRFDRIREAAEELFSSGDVHAGTEAARPRLFGGFAFHADSTDGSPWEDFPGARFVFPRVQVTYAENGTWLTVNAVGPDANAEAVEERLARERERIESLPDPGPVSDPPGVVHRRRTTAKDDWNAGVNAAVERISAGDLRKVVLAQALAADLASDLSVPDILDRLGDSYPDCYRFLVEPEPDADRPQASFFGATPERLVSLRGRTVETGALAGTTGRGETPAEDEWLARELLDDEKNVHEHELVAETIRDQLAPFASSVNTGDRCVKRLATVQHLWTPITATLATSEHVLSLVEALHPTPAVGGLPPEKALETIRDTEPFDRGWYAAPVGWIDAAGYGSFAVALRSAVSRDDTTTLFAGVGVVEDSDPDREWDEVQLKYRALLDELER